uniref:endonuclease V n=1 Tax=Euleptes europaea TaxID=460621 RepID=UPI0025404401|nr:endonuclease V [Euleptes europaea]
MQNLPRINGLRYRNRPPRPALSGREEVCSAGSRSPGAAQWQAGRQRRRRGPGTRRCAAGSGKVQQKGRPEAGASGERGAGRSGACISLSAGSAEPPWAPPPPGCSRFSSARGGARQDPLPRETQARLAKAAASPPLQQSRARRRRLPVAKAVSARSQLQMIIPRGQPVSETITFSGRDQAQLKAEVIEQDTEEWQGNPSFAGLERVGGVDLSYVKGDDTSACASLVVLSYPDLKVLYEDCRMVVVNAPYVAGFLAFREAPFLVEAVQRLEEHQPGLRPQVLLVDGNGTLHHRGFGIACHLGVLTGLPCIGVAKNLLQVDGLANDELHKEKIRDLQVGGDTFPLSSTSGRILGMALRSYAKSTKPVYISVGHKTSLQSAVSLVHSCCRYRVPEPIRQADIRSREYIRKHVEAASAALSPPERMSEDADSE